MILDDLKNFFEKLDGYRDKALFVFIKPYWPRSITPNHITYARIVIGAALFVVLFLFGIVDKPVIIALFCIGALSDLFDGSVSRGLNKATEFGAMLDPVADRILILPIAVYSLYASQKWLLLFLILIEVIGAIISMFHKSKEAGVKANIFGKVKMVMFSIVFIAVLVVWPHEPPVFFIDILWASLLFSFLSILSRTIEMSKKGYIKNKVINKQLNKLSDQ